jgi:hypothetical protein
MNNTIDFLKKYLKYKSKYINLKNMVGGSSGDLQLTDYAIRLQQHLDNKFNLSIDQSERIKIIFSKKSNQEIQVIFNTINKEITTKNIDTIINNLNKK